ncbi:MAG: hypothetical protein HY906_24390 [Deltaproteobacteria bacterium]|nr:hypothetical protein [Deltaproteobacteria bacterium]
MRARLLLAALGAVLLASGCSGAIGGAGHADAGDGSAGGDGLEPAADGPGDDGSAADAGPDGAAPCPEGVTCVTTFPFGEDRDTSLEPPSRLEGYSCSTADESGPEVIYRVTVPEAGFLSAAVYEDPGVDVDVHLLRALDPATCLDRGNVHARADVEAGDWFVVVDTYVSSGTPRSGPFHVDLGFTVPSRGPCAMETGEMARVGDGGSHLAMPATGPMVMEAHLVTQEEPPPYPSTATEHLAEHYALSQGRTGFVLHRTQSWAPLEGGSFYGCGIGSPTDFPVEHEAWYVNMYWTQAARPAKGTRLLLRDPAGSRAVVAAAGYETGPGNLAHVGGTPEESHFFLRTTHLGPMQIGIAVDQALPFGPRICTD